MPLRLCGVWKNEQIHSKMAEMVWWNISGVIISHVLLTNNVLMAHGWRTCGAYGAWMVMPLHIMSCMRTGPLHIHGASNVCTTYIPCMHSDQRDSMVYGRHLYSAWAAYMPNLWNTPHSILVVTLANVWTVNGMCEYPVEYVKVQFNLANLISHVHHRNSIVLKTGISYL